MSANLQARLETIRQQRAFIEAQIIQTADHMRNLERTLLQLQGAEAMLLELLAPTTQPEEGD